MISQYKDVSMKIRTRLSKEERRNQICSIARKLFIEKGLENTSMKDIMKESGISVGGLYHHYDDIYDILKDTIMLAEDQKNDMFLEIRNRNPEMKIEDLLVESALSVLFDTSDYSILYVLLLVGMKKNEGLKTLYKERKDKAKKEYLSLLKELNAMEFECLANDEFINFFNLIKIGNYYLEDDIELTHKKKVYEDFIRTYINKNNKMI